MQNVDIVKITLQASKTQTNTCAVKVKMIKNLTFTVGDHDGPGVGF